MKVESHVPILAVFLAAAVALIVLHFLGDVSPLENALLQVLILGIGLLGSYIFARNSARAGAREVVRPHARAAFRRVTTLYNSLYRLSIKIEGLKAQAHDHRLDLIQALVNEQIATGQDAMEDWRDIIPDEVTEVERRSAQR